MNRERRYNAEEATQMLLLDEDESDDDNDDLLRCVKALRKKNLAKFIHLEIFDCDRMRLT